VKSHIPESESLRWPGIELTAYKSDARQYQGVTRQVLFSSGAGLGATVRYFEVAPGGHTTLERHDHVHAVIVVRGQGNVLVGEQVFPVTSHDLVYVPSRAWHQFRACEDAVLGFICIVNEDRDKPELPDDRALATLRENATISAFIRVAASRQG
jgi:quercetin dioxygenase-like cupin family protein